jgi:predicted nucleic acid-binding protein
MSGISLFADTNILVYLFNGNERIAELLDENELYISFITELELFGKKNLTATDKQKILKFVNQCFVVDINTAIKKKVINLRENYSIKLPDAIIAASAIEYDLPLFTADKQMEVIKELNSFIIEI